MKIFIAHNEYIHRGGEDLCVDREIAALLGAGLAIVDFRPRSGSRFSTYRSALLAPFGWDLEGRLEKQLTIEQPDILHVHNLFPLLSPRIFTFAKRLGIKTVLTLHNYRPLCLNGLFMTPDLETCERCVKGGYLSGISRGCYRSSRLQSLGLAAHLTVQRDAYKAVDSFIAPGTFLRDKFVQYGFRSDKIVVQGHFLPDFPTAPPTAPEPYALYLGRLSEEKGLCWLLSMFGEPKAPLRLKVAGTGPMEQQVRRAAGSGNSIEYVGYVTGEQKQDLLRKASMMIVPSDCYENFPLNVMEANALGVPVIGTDHGGLRDIIVAGENGFRYPRGDQDAFWNVLLEIAKPGHGQVLRISSQQYAHRHFAKDQFLQTRLSLYNDIVRGVR